MGLFSVHEAEAQKRFFPPLFLVVPHGVDDLHLIELTDRDNVVAEVGVADHHIEHHVAGRQQQHVEPPLLFIALGQEFIDVAERHLAIGQCRTDFFPQRGIIDLQSLLVWARRRNCRNTIGFSATA